MGAAACPTTPLAAWRWLSAGLAARHAAGRPVGPWPDWLVPEAVASLSLTLAPGGIPRHLTLGVSPGLSPHALPAHLPLAGRHQRLPLHRAALPLARAQAAPALERATAPWRQGTATCLVRDRLAPSRTYLLTCGHVLAPTPDARWDDVLAVRVPGLPDLTAQLREWQPVPGATGRHARFDAGLAEVLPATVEALRASPAMTDWFALGLADTANPGAPLQVKCAGGDKAATLRTLWAGKVLGPDDSSDVDDYYLQEALGYTCREGTRPGDSGAAIWTDDQRLLGMHLGRLDEAGAAGANAVLGLVAPVLRWYQIKPFTRWDPASLTPADRPDPVPGTALRATRQLPAGLAPLAGDTHDVQVLAQTLWGEAEGEHLAGMEAVAAVICNRRSDGRRGRTLTEVCLWPSQFDCWRPGSARRQRVERIAARPDDAYRQALDVARRAAGGALRDPTGGARHFVTLAYWRSVQGSGHWAARPYDTQIGNHVFFRGIPY